MNIALIGFMGTGKTTIGKIVSKKIGFSFYDIDSIIELNEKKSISDIFIEYGEKFFRHIEAEVIEEASKKNELVISCGGGAVLDKKNIENLRTNAIIINLQTDPETIYKRVKNKANRPVLGSKNISIEKIKELLYLRKDAYLNCDFSIDSTDIKPEKAADMIVEIFYKNGGKK
ncbi:MAG: shikimate kinase [Elusimicrobiota bacterium]|jgi:shikimate kinase|nr:shikimate kinase [Elusimicrobiota bacterium]